MINNRQAGRRNRGRNNNNSNGRPNNNQSRGNSDTGNRIDNRARGNATQLLEKYRNMARDSQLAGDRVNTEYYLQFADHYFRVLADNRARQEEAQNGGQQPMRPRPEPTYDEFGDEYDTGDISNGGGNGNMGNGPGDYDDRPQQQAPRDSGRDNMRDNRENGRDNDRGNGQREGRQPYQNRDENRGNEARGNENRGNEGRRTEYRNEGRTDGRSDMREEGRRDEGRRDRQQPRRDEQRREAPAPVSSTPASVAQELPLQDAPVTVEADVAAEAPRRRGRPPKNRDVAPEAVTQDAPAAPVAAASVAAEDATVARRGLRQRRPREESNDDVGGGLDLAVLPPAITRTEADNDSAPAAEDAPRKRVRRARPAAEAAE